MSNQQSSGSTLSGTLNLSASGAYGISILHGGKTLSLDVEAIYVQFTNTNALNLAWTQGGSHDMNNDLSPSIYSPDGLMWSGGASNNGVLYFGSNGASYNIHVASSNLPSFGDDKTVNILKVTFDKDEDYKSIDAGSYNATANLTNSYYAGGLDWTLTTEEGDDSAEIDEDGVVTFGEGWGKYTIRAESSVLDSCYDEMTLWGMKVSIMETNTCIAVTNTLTLCLTTNSTPDTQWEITPSVQNGASIQGSSAGTSVVINVGSVATNYMVRAYAQDFTNCYDTCTVWAVNVGMVPDFNHDRVINDADQSQITTNGPFRFWINDDGDSDNEASDSDSDVPGKTGGSANYNNDQVDGRCDLIDFSAIWVNIHDLLKAFLVGEGYEYYLFQTNSALNIVYTDLTKDQAGKYITIESSQYGAGFNQAAYQAGVTHVTSAGAILQEGFLNRITDNANKGVLLVEGSAATTQPLELEVRKDGQVFYRLEMSISVTNVESMYRHINLRPSGGLATSTNQPANYPDSLCNDKNVFFIHGFSVDGDGARGWHAEMFKRLYWSESKAKFWGITWQGDLGLIDALCYQENVANTFLVATNLYAHVNGVSGTKIILAHSLGNMVVSSAIQDCDLSVNKYFMLNAAVATECYDASVFNESTNGNYMLHGDWQGYNSNSWCSTWHKLFSSPDDRADLTWRDRFPSVLSVAYNLYSSGDEIFEVYTNGTPSAFANPFHLERYAWQKQEMFKGRTIVGVPVPGGTAWAGWGFSGEYTQEQANNATADNLRTNAVFRHEPSSMFSSNITAQTVNEINAQGVPALSYADGVNEIEGVVLNYNANDHKQNGWGRSGGDYGIRWLHTDLKDMAYFYTYDLFGQIVTQGGLE